MSTLIIGRLRCEESGIKITILPAHRFGSAARWSVPGNKCQMIFFDRAGERRPVTSAPLSPAIADGASISGQPIAATARARHEFPPANCATADAKRAHGKFGIAMIGLFDPLTLDVTPAAWAGVDAEVATKMKSTADRDAQLGQGTIGRSIREHRPVFTNNMGAEPAVGSKRHDAIKCGYRSVISLPLMLERAVFGVFTLLAKEQNFFNAEEIKLLLELAGDISFALEHITKEEKLNYLAGAISSMSRVAVSPMYPECPVKMVPAM